jgi:hypothetical protein
MAMATSSRFAPDATFTNGRYELPPARVRGEFVLVLADPPEAGWRMRTHSDDQAADAELLASHGHEFDRQLKCDSRFSKSREQQ